jgi:hypothetical protein
MLMSRSVDGGMFDYQIYPYTDGSVIYQVYNGGAYGHIGIGVILAPVNQWHFLVCDYNGAGTFTMQINNATSVTGALGVLPDFDGGGVMLGDHGWPGGTAPNSWDGHMQHWFMFARTLSPADRTYLWNAGAGRHFEELSTAFKTDLRAWWPLDETSGSRRDQSGNSNTLTDVNTVTSALGHVAGLTPADGAPVSIWEDSGPNDFHLGAAGAIRPTWQADERNGKAVMRFDGADDRMTTATILGEYLAGPSAQTIFVVQRQLASASSTFNWPGDGTSALNVHLPYSDNALYYDSGFYGSNRITATAPEPFRGTWHIVELVRDGTGGAMVIEGNPLAPTFALSGTFNPAAASAMTVGSAGATLFMQGDLAEVIIFNRTLTPAERDTVRNYLKLKWGIAQNKLITTATNTGYLFINSATNDRLAIN